MKGNMPYGWTDCDQIWHAYADSSGNGHKLKQIKPSSPQEAWGGEGVSVSNIQKCEKTATNTCIIMLEISRAKTGNPASIYSIL